MNNTLTKTNNFDLIRILAALQVVIGHTKEHLDIQSKSLDYLFIYFLKFFPGVPIFFTLSGFLIIWSYDRNKNDLFKFFKNRLLRIYPALWVCFITTIGILIVFKVINFTTILDKSFIFWIITQVTFLQFYTPDFMRSFGVGNPNGSLFTISIEIQYYILVPFLYYLIFSLKNKTHQILAIISIFISSILIYQYFNTINTEQLMRKISGILVLPYLYNFLFGILIYKYWSLIEKYILENGFVWFLIYVSYFTFFSVYLNLYSPSYWPNIFGFISNLLLAILTISSAYTFTSISNKILYHQDLSYGVYIYHMLIVNVLIELGKTQKIIYLLITLFTTLLIAFLSWNFIEKPFLARKKNSNNTAS